MPRTVSITAGFASRPTSSTRVPTSRPYATSARLMYALPQPASTTRIRSRPQIGSGRTAAREEPLALLRAPRVQVALGREQVHVARAPEQLVEARRPRVPRDGLGSAAVLELDRCAALELDRSRGDAVGDELAPAYAARSLAKLVHRRKCASGTTSSSGGGRRRNDATRSSSSAASGASVGSARSTAARPAAISGPRAACDRSLLATSGRAHTTCPFATKNAVRAPSSRAG